MKKIFIVLVAILASALPMSAQCPPIVVTNSNPWVEDFSTQPGSCWTFTESFNGWQYHMASAGNNAYMEHVYSSLTYDAITPMFDISGVTTPYFKIKHYQPDYEGSNVADNIQILYRASETDDWTLLHTFDGVYNTWTLDSMALPSNLTNIQLNIRGVGMGWNADGCAFDDLSVYNENNVPICFAPYGLAVSNVTTSSADLTWSTNSGGIIELHYKASTETDYTSLSGVALTNGVYTLGNLDDNTTYTWYLTLECADGTVLTSTTVSFTTLCLPISTLPYYEDFDNTPQYTIPSCWSQINPFDGYPQIESGYAHNANALKFKCNYNTPTPIYAVLPAFDTDLSDLQLTFWTRREGSYSGTLNVGYIADVTDTTTFVSLLDVTAASIGDNSYHFYTVNFDGVEVPEDSLYFIAFKYMSQNNWYWFIDEVTVQEIPGCEAPVDLSVDDIADDHVTLHWNSDEPFFVVSYRIAGTTDWTTVENIANPDSTGYVLNGLAPTTNYEWFVSTDCGGGEYSDSYISTFTTNCAIYTVPFSENFNAINNTPNCWSKYTGLASSVFAGAQLFPYSYGWNFTNVNVFGSYHASINVYGQSTQYWLVSPAIYLGGVVNPVLTFDLALTAYNSVNPPSAENVQADDKFMVIISTDNGATWSAANATVWCDDTATADYPYSQIPAGGQEVSISLIDYANQTVMIAFYAETTVSGGDNDLHIDNVFVGEGSGCSKPNQFALAGVTATSATLTWNETGDATAWNIQYGPTGFTLDDDDAVTVSATSTTYTVNNLTTVTTYDFYVQANCGNDQSNWVGPITVTPGSYSMAVSGSDTLITCDMIVYDNGGATGDYSPYCDATLIIYNEIDGNAITVSGTYNTESCCDYLQIFDGAGTDGTMLGEFKGNGVITPLVSSTGPITLFFHSDYAVQESGFALNVSCTSCMPPANVTASSVTTNSAELSWTSNGAATSWIVEYRPMGDTIWNSTTCDNTTLVINNLLVGTAYEVSVSSNCGGGDISMPTTFQFITLMEATTLPYTTDFSENADQNWLLNNSNCLNYWMMGSLSDTASALFVTNNGYSPGYNTNATSVVTAEKLFTIGDAVEYNISFDVLCGGEGNWDFMKVFFAPETSQYPATSSSSEVPGYSGADFAQYAVDFTDYVSDNYPYKLNLTQDNLLHVEASMPNPNDTADATSTAKLVFMWRNDYITGTQPGAVLYNVSVSVSTCPKPSNLTVSNITNHSADVSWTAGDSESAWNLEYKEANSSIWTEIPVTTTTYTLTNLSVGVAYDVRVQANCGGGDLSSYTNGSFTTTADTVGPVVTDPTVTTTAATNIEQTIATLNGSVTNPDNVTITAQGFEWKATVGGTYAPVTVTGNNLTYNLSGLTANTSYTYKAFITFNGTTVYGNEVTFSTLEEVVTCATPTNLHQIDVPTKFNDGFIYVEWVDNAGVSQWNLQYKLSSATEWNNVVVTGGPNYWIYDLEPFDEYDIRVQAICSEDNLSAWSNILTATAQSVGIDNYLENSVAIYPNPANDVVNVECTMYNVQLVEVIDVYGKLINTVSTAAALQQPYRINVSGLASGMYFVRVTTGDGVVTKRFVKK